MLANSPTIEPAKNPTNITNPMPVGSGGSDCAKIVVTINMWFVMIQLILTVVAVAGTIGVGDNVSRLGSGSGLRLETVAVLGRLFAQGHLLSPVLNPVSNAADVERAIGTPLPNDVPTTTARLIPQNFSNPSKPAWTVSSVGRQFWSFIVFCSFVADWFKVRTTTQRNGGFGET